jgi:hypothetical protein
MRLRFCVTERQCVQSHDCCSYMLVGVSTCGGRLGLQPTDCLLLITCQGCCKYTPCNRVWHSSPGAHTVKECYSECAVFVGTGFALSHDPCALLCCVVSVRVSLASTTSGRMASLCLLRCRDGLGRDLNGCHCVFGVEGEACTAGGSRSSLFAVPTLQPMLALQLCHSCRLYSCTWQCVSLYSCACSTGSAAANGRCHQVMSLMMAAAEAGLQLAFESCTSCVQAVHAVLAALPCTHPWALGCAFAFVFIQLCGFLCSCMQPVSWLDPGCGSITLSLQVHDLALL